MTGEGPDNGWSFAAHTADGYRCGYSPLLTDGRLIKARDPAWQMPEKTRDPGCLTELVRVRAVKAPTDRRPGYNLGFFHSHRSQREYPGYPDCHIWGVGSAHRELKRMGRSSEPDQAATLTRMRRAGLDVGVWWPCCWYAGRIDAELGALAGRSDFDLLIGPPWAPGLPPQPGQAGYTPWTPPPPAPGSADARPTPPPPGRAQTLAPTTTPATTPPALEMPGADLPTGFAASAAIGYTVPMPGDNVSADAAWDLDWWLREHGFQPTAVPYPIRIVDTPFAGVAVQCRTGAPGSPRVWRWAPLKRPFPDDLVRRLEAVLVSGRQAAAMLDGTAPARPDPS